MYTLSVGTKVDRRPCHLGRPVIKQKSMKCAGEMQLMNDSDW